MPLHQDQSRLVRTEASRVLVSSGTFQTLSETERTRVSLALREVKKALMSASDRAGSHLGWANLCEAQGRYREAVQAYETAIRVEPEMTGARSNLAGLLEGLASQQPGPQAGQLQQRADQLRQDELPLLARDADLAPENGSIQYRYGLALYLAGQMEQAMNRLELAVELEPDVPDFRQARDLLKQKLQEGQ